MTGVLDWARSRGIGFSSFISLGESPTSISATCSTTWPATAAPAPSCCTSRPALCAQVHVGRARGGAQQADPGAEGGAARSRPGAPAPACPACWPAPDDVYDAAIRRAGMLRVYTTEQLFAAVETLARAKPLYGERLAILCNGAGPVRAGPRRAAVRRRPRGCFSPRRRCAPAARPGAGMARQRPAQPARRRPARALPRRARVLLHDPQADAVLMIHAPNAVVDPADVARAVAPLAKASSRNVLACWLGGSR
jgi:acetyltransferase